MENYISNEMSEKAVMGSRECQGEMAYDVTMVYSATKERSGFVMLRLRQ